MDASPLRTSPSFSGRDFPGGTWKLRLFQASEDNRYWPVAFGTSHCLSDQQFLCVRGALAIVFVLIQLADLVVHFGGGLYFIYLTVWTFIVQTTYFILAVRVTLDAQKALPAALDQPLTGAPQPVHLPRKVKCMWLVWSIAMPMSLTVSCAFWTMITPIWKLDSIFSLSFFIVFEHFLNAVLLGVELFLSRNPFSLRYMGVFFVYAGCFVGWSFVHYLAEIGVSRSAACDDYPIRDCPIYPVLDWHHPLSTFATVLGIMLVGAAAYVIVWYLTRERDLADRLKRHMQQGGRLSISSVL